MIYNFFKIALRQLLKNKIFSCINVFGLSLGMAVVVMIALFVKNELSYDLWMEASDRTYRVYRQWGSGSNVVWTPSLLAQKISDDFSEVESTTGFSPGGEQLIEYDGNKLYIHKTATVDSTFFNVLAIPFLYGSPLTALHDPKSMVITDELSEKLFGIANPVGELIKFGGDEDYIITGVLDIKNRNTHIQSDIFTRFQWYSPSWSGNNRATYVRLKEKASIQNLEEKLTTSINDLIENEYLSINYTPTSEDFADWKLQPLNDVHLQSDNYGFMSNSEGSMNKIYIFILIGILMLGIAIINYVNLATARASQRAKEVGIKKVMGAGRTSLAVQFITEALLQSFIAAGIAILLSEALLPIFNTITDRELHLLAGDQNWIIFSVFVLALFTGLLAGIYPSLIISSYRPVTALNANYLNFGGKGVFRKMLVTSQFAITITLLIVMGFIYRQVNFMTNYELGFYPDQVMTIPLNLKDSHRKIENIRSRFESIPGVNSVTTSSRFPSQSIPDWGMLIEGKPDAVSANVIFCDSEYTKTLSIEMAEGRFLSSDIAQDTVDNYVVNEEFINRNNIEIPIGTRVKFTSSNTYGKIVGVMKNFHFRDLGRKIAPLVIGGDHRRWNVGIKLSATNIPSSIESIRELWNEIEPQHPMRYSFLDEDFATQYSEQKRYGKTLMYATVLTLFISLLGLFGFTVFNVERRTREIGIRKVLGSSITGIVTLLSIDFLKMASVAFLIALPISFYFSSLWLENFSYRTNLTWWVFVLAGLFTIGIGFLTVSFQSIKAAMVNPIESLRTE